VNQLSRMTRRSTLKEKKAASLSKDNMDKTFSIVHGEKKTLMNRKKEEKRTLTPTREKIKKKLSEKEEELIVSATGG